MFGIGGGEFLVIALVALIAVGPEQLPSVMRKFGGYVGQLRTMADGVRGEFMAGVDELDPVKWTGDGSDEKPIVPRGFAESATTTLGTPVAKPRTAPMADNDTIDQAFGKKGTEAEGEAKGTEAEGEAKGTEAEGTEATAAEVSAPPVNSIAAANARPTPESAVESGVEEPGADQEPPTDPVAADTTASDPAATDLPAPEAAAIEQEPPAS